MPASVLSAFLVLTVVTAFTPGPNNILILHSAGRHGLRGSVPLLAGICSGFFCVMVLCGLISFSLLKISDNTLLILRYAGCLYIAWLAWKVAFAKMDEGETVKAGSGFLSGFILQFVNAKIIVYGLTAFSGFILPWHTTFLPVAGLTLTLVGIGCAGILSWWGAGAALQRFYQHHARTANLIMGLMLLGCALALLF
ncbi:MAG: LysE family transporter [Desulfovibrionaceae bacterium]|nr:LysE family transporter [Desulfovibrionaceae bacterium]